MSHLISIKVIDTDYTKDEDLYTAKVTITTEMNLSEEFAVQAAQYALSTELGCDLDRVEQYETEATYFGADYAWLVTFENITEDEDED